MTIYLLIFSFILHGVTILLMLTLAKKVSVTDSFDPERGEKVKQEIEDMLFAYTVEMKEENERLLKEIKQLKKEPHTSEQKTKSVRAEVPQNKQAEPSLSTRPLQLTEQDEQEEQKYNDYSPPDINEEDPATIFEQSDTANVLMLAKRGMNEEQIAKQLNIGKGEVELILKFYR
ncbi:hypothetical protein AB3N04_18675 [Alkalihalophilus sp. As8PL]|uniref:Coupling factor for flagellin transcription and translation n=1 Tax=Alkalihalophilus sp. As8PL TaxID=3237103 RepID=A0AB39BT69_9BACI